MPRLPALVLLAALAVGIAPTAAAQVGPLLAQAPEADGRRAPDAARPADASARRAALAPAVDFAALLDTRFYRDRGTFDLGEIPLLFPPPGLAQREAIDAGWRLCTASGEVTGRQTLARATETLAAAIVVLQTQAGVPGDDQAPLEPGGRYSLDVEVVGELAGSVPFTAAMAESGDPHRPSTAWVLEGRGGRTPTSSTPSRTRTPTSTSTPGWGPTTGRTGRPSR